jgi:hypothetical protein
LHTLMCNDFLACTLNLQKNHNPNFSSTSRVRSQKTNFSKLIIQIKHV